MTGTHVQPMHVIGQSPMGHAVQLASTQGLLLLIPPQQQDTCPVWGHTQQMGWRYCSQCGIKLRCPTCNTLSLGKSYCPQLRHSLEVVETRHVWPAPCNG